MEREKIAFKLHYIVSKATKLHSSQLQPGLQFVSKVAGRVWQGL